MMRKVFAVTAALSLLCLGLAAQADVVYSNNFEIGAGPEWTNAPVEATPGTLAHPSDRFLGQFGHETTRLSLTGLPGHNSVTLSFDLYIIRSWDGNWGPDIWDLTVVGGPTLLHTTFSHEPGVRPQAFPDQYPGGYHEAGTGAAEIDSLGYYFWTGISDQVYRLSYTFAHQGDSLSLDFIGMTTSEIPDESWGLDNVVVTAVPEPSGLLTMVLGLSGLAGLAKLRRK